ncbi:MAG: hypothetical protein H6Q90_6550 [Deltaproteobacteria bacterium]|nr:hypothetical protein [Deltaproteobacteria bacterium]
MDEPHAQDPSDIARPSRGGSRDDHARTPVAIPPGKLRVLRGSKRIAIAKQVQRLVAPMTRPPLAELRRLRRWFLLHLAVAYPSWAAARVRSHVGGFLCTASHSDRLCTVVLVAPARAHLAENRQLKLLLGARKVKRGSLHQIRLYLCCATPHQGECSEAENRGDPLVHAAMSTRCNWRRSRSRPIWRRWPTRVATTTCRAQPRRSARSCAAARAATRRSGPERRRRRAGHAVHRVRGGSATAARAVAR